MKVYRGPLLLHYSHDKSRLLLPPMGHYMPSIPSHNTQRRLITNRINIILRTYSLITLESDSSPLRLYYYVHYSMMPIAIFQIGVPDMYRNHS